MSDDVQTAQERVDAALAECNAAAVALGAARSEETRLMEALKEALDSERIAAENGAATAELTARVRHWQDALRLHSYRIRKLETDAAMRQSDYTDLLHVLYAAQEQAAHVRLSAAAEAFQSALSAAAEAKRAYLSAIDETRGAASVVDRDITDLQPENVARVVRWAITLELLPTELFSGRDYRGKPIEGAADIRKIIGMSSMPLIR